MSKLFNSIYEISLRILIQLFVLDGEEKTADYISSLDYLSLYSKTFKIGDYDLHGENPYRLGELATRLKSGRQALKTLVSKGFASVSGTSKGFVFKITDIGKEVIGELKLDYAMNYMNIAIDVQDYFSEYADTEVLNHINGISRERRM
ncbi:ABC-three component system middle component 2 [Allofustis seminis]|uniref:ABC-three component system middle component 2 n=1 Tax=Allofustis seminis TaxID=166939 RepID=UPI000368A36E|nr:ABC-three component system middle component 2 [Allofustis seminis]